MSKKLFEVLDLPRQLRNCCRSLEGKGNRFYNHGKLLQILIVHLVVGSRKLREMDYYREDPMVCEAVGLKRLPSVPTVSRMLRKFDKNSVSSQRELNRRLILSTFFSDEMISDLEELKVEYSISVPFELFDELKEKIIAELKSQAQMDYTPARNRTANQVYLLCSMMAHNLGREFQMQANPPARGVTLGRPVHWVFEELSTLRHNIIQRAGRLTLGVNLSVQDTIQRFMPL